MHVIVGLGNPGAAYERTRHNAGFDVVERLATRHAPGEPARSRFHGAVVDAHIHGHRCMLLKPLTYMNRSGAGVVEAIHFYKLDPASDLVVIADDVALDVGYIRVRTSGSAGGHNGLADIERALGTRDYTRVRVGVGRPPGTMDQADYVLRRPAPDDQEGMAGALDRAADAVECIISQSPTEAMNRFNQRMPRPGAGQADAPQAESGPTGPNEWQ